MARLAGDQRGAIYVEFLLAFPPLFLLFLGICQLCLVATAKLVVQHAANRAARSAIVVLEETPERHGGALRGHLSGGSVQSGASLEDLFGGLDLVQRGARLAGFSNPLAGAAEPLNDQQRGTRMIPIRNSAYLPLLALAPASGLRTADESLGDGLRSDFADRLFSSLDYTRSAAVVTLNAGPGSRELAPEPVAKDAAITVRVTYFYRCSVPVVRALVCRSLSRLLQESFAASGDGGTNPVVSMKQRFDLAEDPKGLASLAGDSFFSVLEAEATLPNQGAGYYPRGTE